MIVQRLFAMKWGLVPLVLSIFLQSNITITENRATLDFPDAIDFHLEANSPSEIVSAELEVRTDALACGESATQIIPDDFTAGTSIAVDWTWELRRTGALPPGSIVSWQWVLRDAEGGELKTPQEQLVIEDASHSWQQIESEELVLHWYDGTEARAQALLSAGQAAVDKLEESLNTTLDKPIRVYIYPGPDEMQSATLFAPGWSGGLAFTDYGALLLAVGSDEEEWGKRAIAHELTHIVVGRYTFSCVTSTPNWFTEGIAMYSEGEPDSYYVDILDKAVQADKLLSVRELGQIFSNDPDVALLSYAQSTSLVTFLIDEYGEDKILPLLDLFKEGAAEDRALTEVYGFDSDGLEVAWREWVGAAPMKSTPTDADTPRTPYPTFAPIVEPPPAVSEVRPTPQYLATLSPGVALGPTKASATVPASSSGLSDAALPVGVIIMICIAGVALIGAGVVFVMIVLRSLQKDTHLG